MRPQIPKRHIKSIFTRYGPRASQFVDLASDRQPYIDRIHLCGSNAYGELSSLFLGDLLSGVGVKDFGSFVDDVFDESGCSPELGLKVTVADLDVGFVSAAGDGGGLVGPTTGVGFGVSCGAGEGSFGDTEVERGENELDLGQVERVVGPNRLELFVDVSKCIRPRNDDVGDANTSRLSTAHTKSVDPLITVHDTRLSAQHGSKDMLTIRKRSFQNGNIADLTSSRESLLTIVDELIRVVLVFTNLKVGITRIDSTTDKVLVLCDPIFVLDSLFVGSDESSSPRPKVVVADELTERSITTSNDADDLVGFFPSQACSAGGFGSQDGNQTSVFEKLDLTVGDDIATVTDSFILVKKFRDLFSTSKDFLGCYGVFVELGILNDFGVGLDARSALNAGRTDVGGVIGGEGGGVWCHFCRLRRRGHLSKGKGRTKGSTTSFRELGSYIWTRSGCCLFTWAKVYLGSNLLSVCTACLLCAGQYRTHNPSHWKVRAPIR